MTRARRTASVILGAIAALVVTGAVAWLAIGGLAPSRPSETMTKSSSLPGRPPGLRTATDLGRSFLANWVTAGRVVRHDQGNDTVSEGQAYGLLISLGVHDKKQFNSIWKWTRTNLMRSDGLLAWRWSNGAVVDDQPAADADLDTARALVLAGKEFDQPSLTKRGVSLGDAILKKLTVKTQGGRILLPGIWAKTSPPWAYNPSYASPVSFDVLGRASKDARWKELENGSRTATTALLGKAALPPDWARADSDGSAVDATAPSGASGVRYSFDAARLPLRYAESCTARDRELAAKLAPTLRKRDPLSMELDLGGGQLGSTRSPLAYSARAASLAADKSVASAWRDLAQSASVANETPTYYGSAWATLASLMLTTDRLGGCPALEKG